MKIPVGEAWPMSTLAEADRETWTVVQMEKKWGVFDSYKVLLDVRGTNVAVVTATVSRSVLPLVYDEALTASAVMEEERGD